MVIIDDQLISQLTYLIRCRVTQIFGVEQALNEYDFVLICFTLRLQLSAKPDEVLAQYLSFFILHGVIPNTRSAQRQRGHRP